MGTLTDTNIPGPCTSNVAGDQQIWGDRVKHEHPAPHIESIVPVVGKQEGVVNPEGKRFVESRHKIEDTERT